MSELLKEELEEQEDLKEQEDLEERFVVDSDEKAEWCMKKIWEAKENVDLWEAHYAAQLDRIKAQAQETIEKMQFMLEEYFNTVPHKKTKTEENYKLPSGKLVRKKQQPEYKKDEKVMLEWIKENMPDYLKVKETVDWDGLKKVTTAFNGNIVNADGEIVPGVTVVERPDIFKVEVK